MPRLTVAILGSVLLLLLASPASAYVWRCHTPSGDTWTSQPGPSDNCEEYDPIYNQGAAPPALPSFPPQMAPEYPQMVPPPAYLQLPAASLNSTLVPPPPPPPPMYAYDPYPWPYEPYYPGYYGRPGLYLGLPGVAFDFRFGFGHRAYGWYGGHRWHR